MAFAVQTDEGFLDIKYRFSENAKMGKLWQGCGGKKAFKSKDKAELNSNSVFPLRFYNNKLFMTNSI